MKLTAGEECQIAAKSFSSFSGHIPATLVKECMGMAILKGTDGVSVIRLPSGEWSAPCAISLESMSNTIAPQQETVLLFMSEVAIYSLVTRANVALNQTHRFEPGPFESVKRNEPIDIYVYVRFNGGFTPSDLIAANMVGWRVKEDTVRHATWHGDSVTWFDVLTNKISVDRSSVGNALYLVLNLAAGSSSEQSRSTKKNYADVESWVNVAPSFKKVSQPAQPIQPVQPSGDYSLQNPYFLSYNTYDIMPQMPLSNQINQIPQMPQVYMNQGQYPNQTHQMPNPTSQYQSTYPTQYQYMYGQQQPYQGQQHDQRQGFMPGPSYGYQGHGGQGQDYYGQDYYGQGYGGQGKS